VHTTRSTNPIQELKLQLLRQQVCARHTLVCGMLSHSQPCPCVSYQPCMLCIMPPPPPFPPTQHARSE
jgi:hypothetical protein